MSNQECDKCVFTSCGACEWCRLYMCQKHMNRVDCDKSRTGIHNRLDRLPPYAGELKSDHTNHILTKFTPPKGIDKVFGCTAYCCGYRRVIKAGKLFEYEVGDWVPELSETPDPRNPFV